MKIGLAQFPIRPDYLLPVAQRADMLGYESIWLAEHLVFPAQIETPYPYNPNAGAPLPTTPLYDPLISFAYLAARTERIKLATGIYVLPLRHPIEVAKLVATLDVWAGGRTILGVGAGWLREEFEAVGAVWEHRGSRMEEMIDIMRRLWREEAVEYNGSFYRFREIGFEPKPPRGGVPILIGGESPAALQRAARCGDGWQGMHHPPEEAAEFVRKLHTLRGDERPFEISMNFAGAPDLDTLRRYRDAGVERITFAAKSLSASKGVAAALDGVERFAHEVMYPIQEEQTGVQVG